MADGAHRDVLGQKAQAAQRAFEARGMSPGKALRRALSRAADRLWSLALVAQDVQLETLDQDGVVEALRPGDLLLLLDGPEGLVGLATFDREVMTGVTEVQTIQQVTQTPVDDRPLTPTDAAMTAPLIEAALAGLVENLADHPLRPQVEGYRFGAMLEDSRAAGLLLEAQSYRVFRANVDLALGRRRGAVSIVLPDRASAGNRDGTQVGDELGPHANLLERVPARLDAILARVNMPLGKAEALQVGDLIHLPVNSLDGVEFVAGLGQLVARGRLGQMDGMRAVRLTWPEVQGANADMAAPGGMDGLADDGLAAAMDAPVMDFGAGGGDFDMSDPPPAPLELPSPGEEELPDLPPMDFAAEADAFDADFGTEAMDFDASPADGEAEELPDLEGFGAAEIEFDAEST